MNKFDFPFSNQTHNLLNNWEWKEESVQKLTTAISNYFFSNYYDEPDIISNMFNIILFMKNNYITADRPTVKKRIDLLVDSIAQKAKDKLQGYSETSKYISSVSSKTGEYDKEIKDKMTYYLLQKNIKEEISC